MLKLRAVPRRLLSTLALLPLLSYSGCTRSVDSPSLNDLRQEEIETEEAEIAEGAMERVEAQTTKGELEAAEQILQQAEAEEETEQVSKRVEEAAKEEPAVLDAISTPVRPTEEGKAKPEHAKPSAPQEGSGR